MILEKMVNAMEKVFEKQHKKKPEFVLADYSLNCFPRFKGGGLSSKFIGWSKPTIRLYALESLRIDQPTEFGNSEVHLAEWSKDRIVLQFHNEKSSQNDKANEQRVIKPNTPINTGSDAGLCDAKCDYYFGCWTSWGRFLQYYFGVRWEHWVDDRSAQLFDMPSYYSKSAIKRRWILRWNRYKRKLEELFDSE